MPGATTGLINIFEVDGETMQIDQEQYLIDIETKHYILNIFFYTKFGIFISIWKLKIIELTHRSVTMWN